MVEIDALEPLAAFRHLQDAARAAGEPDPTVHILATASGGRPSARCLLLKGVDEHGFVLFTNYNSRKAAEIDANPHGAILFFWPRLGVEVRARGPLQRVTDALSDAYFVTRPRGSRLGAWASRQSRRLSWRPWLVVRWLAFAARFFGRAVPRPAFWGGFRLRPEAVEFLRRGGDSSVERTTYLRTPAGWSLARDYFWE